MKKNFVQTFQPTAVQGPMQYGLLTEEFDMQISSGTISDVHDRTKHTGRISTYSYCWID